MSSSGKEIGGINLGEMGQPTRPVISAFKERGVRITHETVINLRKDYTDKQHSGNEIVKRLLAHEVLVSNNAALKDNYYQKIAGKGLELRIRQNREYHRWSSNNFTESIAEALEINPNCVRLALRAMRADLVYMELGNLLKDDLTGLFIKTANQLVDDYTRSVTGRPSAVKDSVVQISEKWDYKTLQSFYSCLYDGRGSLSIGIWTPYEVEVANAFYQGQIAKDDPLTALDKFLLQSYAWNGPSMSQVIELQQKTSIGFRRREMTAHLNVLIHGSTFNPLRTLPPIL